MSQALRHRVSTAGVVALLCAVGLLVLLGRPGRALAHAELENSNPAKGSVLSTAPSVVTLTFGEPVEVARGAVRVFDDAFAPVDRGDVSSPPGRPEQLRVHLQRDLRRGTYVVVYQVSSSDTHPVNGSFRFAVGARSTVRGTAPGTGHNDPAGVLLGVLRWSGFAGLALGPGLLLAALLLWPDALAAAATRRMLWLGLGLLVASTVAGPAMQGVWAGNRPFSALVTDPGSLDSHSRRFDQVYALRIYLVLGFAGVLAAVLRTVPRGPRAPQRLVLVVSVVALALVATWPVVGHAATGARVPLELALNLVHTAAMTLWLGGLALVLPSLRRSGTEVARVLPGLSRLAFASVTTLVVTGSAMSLREVGSVQALGSTTYGRVLVVKLVVVVALLLLGNQARTLVRRATAEASARTPKGLAAGVAAELGLAVGVLALTSALVVLVPAQQALNR